MAINDQINETLTQIFDLIVKEENANISAKGLEELTLNEVHLLVKINDLTTKYELVYTKHLLDELSITKGTLSKSLTKLINKNYLIRQYDARDKRKSILQLKSKAYYAIEIHKQWHEELVKTALTNIDEEKSKEIHQILKNILDNINNNKINKK